VLRTVGAVLTVVLLCVVQGPDAGAQEASLERFVYRQGHMGMEVRLVLYASGRARSERAARAAFERVARLDSLLSSYRSDSELMRVNRRAANGPVPVGDPLFTIVDRAQEVARHSEGALDVTSGPLIQLWREARRTGQLPDTAALRDARQRVGWQHLALDAEAQTLAFRRDGMELNLGGLAKGYILDRTLDVLRDHGISRALVEAGGDLVTGKAPPGRNGWRVDIPHRVAGDTSAVVTVAHSAVATSGDEVQYVQIGDERYSHVIDPRTGLGLTDQPTTTVLARSGIVADALATTMGIKGVEEGRSFVQAHYPRTTVYATQADSTRILQGP